MTGTTTRIDVAMLTALSDPARRRLYNFVRERGGAVTRDEAASALGLARSTVSAHLDRLAADGLLVTSFHKRGERTGPGSGRPAKFYSLAADEVAASIPPRSYDLAADLMAGAIERAGSDGGSVQDALWSVAHEAGAAAAGPRPIQSVLDDIGYEPREDATGYVFENCPFHRLSASHAGVVCSLNQALLTGVTDASGGAFTVEPSSPGAPCCARLTRAQPDGGNAGPAAA